MVSESYISSSPTVAVARHAAIETMRNDARRCHGVQNTTMFRR